MATNTGITGKGKTKKANKKSMPLANFLAEDATAPQGFNVVSTRKLDWADSTEDDLDDTFTMNFKRADKVLLPTAPKATRGPDFDLTQVSANPPFKAYLGNLPYDVTEQEITRYFNKLNVIDVCLPTYNGRQRGFAYAEFTDRQSLIDALVMNGDTFRNRQLKVGLPGDNSDGSSRDNNREEKQDRTATNWRSNPNPREDNSSRDMNRDNYQSYNSRNGANDSSIPDRNMQRNRSEDTGSYGRRYDNDRGFKPSNDRGFDRGFDRSNNYSNARGFERQNDRGFDRQTNNRYGNRFNDRNERTEGYEENRDHGYESNERSFGNRRFEDSNRPTNRTFNERRGDRTDNRRDYGFDRRGRDDSQYESRNTSPPPQRHLEEEGPKERPKLNLKPRSKPIEKTDESIAANSAIFGGAKPVNTAAREQEIEQKLLKEKEEIDKKREPTTEERIRRISAGSNVSGTSRSRKGSDSGRDFEDNFRNNGSNRNPRSRKSSEKSNESAPKYIMTRNKEPSNSSQKFMPVRNDEREGRDQRSYSRGNTNSARNPNNNRRDRDHSKPDTYNRPPRMSNRSDEEEDRKVAYTTSNKFAHLQTEDYDEDEGPIDAHNASD